jgi:hypothetical protein
MSHDADQGPTQTQQIPESAMESGPPSGVTEPGTPKRRRFVALVAAVAVALALLWAGLGAAFFSGQEQSDPAKLPEPAAPQGPPAESPDDATSDDRIGGAPLTE